MRVLIDVTHPAHVHLFKHAVSDLRERGHEVRVTAREKDVTTSLLRDESIPHTVLSRKRSGPVGVPTEWLAREVRLFRLARRTAPDVILSRLNPAAAHVSRALDVPNVVFHDTEIARLLDRFTIPFASVACTPRGFDREFDIPQYRYAGFQELAYVHPARFTPDAEALTAAGIDPDDRYAVVRLVDMTAHHDVGAAGLPTEDVRRFVDGFPGTVYVTSERTLPNDLESLVPSLPPGAVHDLLTFADVYTGDSGTMAAEAGLFGTPAIRFDAYEGSLGAFDALSTYGLVESTLDPAAAVDRALDVALDTDAQRDWRRRRRSMLSENIDVTAFMVDVVEEVAAS